MFPVSCNGDRSADRSRLDDPGLDSKERLHWTYRYQETCIQNALSAARDLKLDSVDTFLDSIRYLQLHYSTPRETTGKKNCFD